MIRVDIMISFFQSKHLFKITIFIQFMIQEQVNNCTCWEDLENMTQAIKACNVGKQNF